MKEETVLFENKYRNIIFIVEVRNEDNKPLGYEMGQFYAMDNNNNRYMISAIGTNSTSKGLGFENISVGGVKHEYLSISFPLNKTLAENELVLRSIVVEK